MAIQSLKNQYVGINANLHSRLQSEPAAWDSFHRSYVAYLGEVIDSLLPIGYFVSLKRSLQMLDEEGVPDDDYLMGLAIGELDELGELTKPMVWIELSHPDNKMGGAYCEQYITRRTAMLGEKLVFVELDYLHQTPSTFKPIPKYPDRDKSSFPYLAMVLDAHPSLDRGTAHVYGFAVDEPMPKIRIPLSGTDQIVLDLGAVYNRTYESYAAYSYRVDYEQEPERIDTYSAADQEHIRRRLRTIQHHHQQGADLEQGPFPLLED